MLERLPITLAQVKEGNTSENLLNDIINYIFFESTIKITKKLYNNIMKSIHNYSIWILYFWIQKKKNFCSA